MTDHECMLPAVEGLGDPAAARLDAIGCLALRMNFVLCPIARDLCLEAIAVTIESIAPKREERQDYNRFRTIQGVQS